MYTGTMIEQLMATVESLQQKTQQGALDSKKQTAQAARVQIDVRKYHEHAVA